MYITEENAIYATRGDVVLLSVSAEDDGKLYTFVPGDVVRFKVYGKKDAENVVLQKDFPITDETSEVQIVLTEEDTKIGDVISKPKDYWYEVELNPFSFPQTIIGYDEDGPKLFRLFPEGADIPEYEYTEKDIPFMDAELDATSTRPVENQAVAREFTALQAKVADAHAAVAALNVTPQMFGAVGDGVADDTEAVQDASDYCAENGYCLRIPSGDFMISNTVDFSNVANVVCEGRLVYTGDDVAVLVNPQGRTVRYTHKINVKNMDSRHTGVGVLIKNIGCSFFDVSAEGFDVGCELLGDGEGCGYNTIYPRMLVSNHTALKLNSKNGGWCNQNVFFSGRIFKWSTDEYDMTGIHITSECGYYSNSNVFYGTNIEGSCKYVIHAEYGQHNRFHEIRNEGCEVTLLETNESSSNTVTVSYGTNKEHVNNAKYIGSYVEACRNRHLPKYRQVFNCEDVTRTVYLTSNRVTSSMFKIMTYDGAKDVVSSSKPSVSGDYIFSEGFPCLALKIDPTVGNRYYVEISCKEEYSGRFAIFGYNNSGGFVTSCPVKTRVHEELAKTEGTGGFIYYQTQVDGKTSIEFEITDDSLRELYIFFKAGTNALYLRSVTVFATGEGRVINNSVPQLNGVPTNAGRYGDIVKSTTDETKAWVMLDTWREITI